ncbi:MAG: RloB domain-containing protein [Haliscomenobacter sp.]|nr:RloB domain-containing protein [Haliscomenobacter sp.]
MENEPIVRYCQSLQGTRVGFALSNPCFEVWLLLHLQDISNVGANSCQDFKKELAKSVRGGYNPEKFLSWVPDAIARCQSLNLDLDHPIPRQNYPSIPGGQSHDGIDLKKIFLLRVEAIQNGLRRRRKSYAGQAERGGWGKNAG